MRSGLPIAIVILLAHVAAADPVRLEYSAHGAGCPDAGRFRDEVAARVGTQPFDDAALSIVRVRIETSGDEVVGTIEASGAAPRELRDHNCVALVETIASTLATRLDSTKLAAAAAPATPPTVVASTVVAPATPRRDFGVSWLSVGLSFSQIWRDDSASGYRGALGYDRKLSAVSIGARVGMARHADSFGSSTLPYLGARVFGWTAVGRSAELKFGGGAELWLNSASETGIRGEPVFLHLLVEAGPRIHIADAWALDIPVELGVMPFFDPKVYTLQLGAQLVYSL